MSVVGATRRSSPVSTPPGPSSTKVCMPSAEKGVEALAPADRAAQLGGQQLRPLVGIVVGAGVDVGDDDRVEGVEGRRRRAPFGAGPGRSDMSGVWKAPPTGIESTRFAPSSLAMTANSSSASEVPATITWPGALKFATHASPSTRRQAVSTVSSSRPEHGDHRPGRALGGLAHGRAPLGDEAEAVLEVERACRDERGVLARGCGPAAAEGSMPRRSAASRTIRLWTKVAIWALSVLVKVSWSASRSRWARSRPVISEASPTSSNEGWSTQAAPMPGRCEPWPGNVNASNLRPFPPPGRAPCPEPQPP